eukprot:scaffold528_cov165-Amphora_coffeaeformis.AAC.35
MAGRLEGTTETGAASHPIPHPEIPETYPSLREAFKLQQLDVLTLLSTRQSRSHSTSGSLESKSRLFSGMT